jgi:hypothetical protein
LQFDIIIGITCIFHLNYKNLRYAVAWVRDWNYRTERSNVTQ